MELIRLVVSYTVPKDMPDEEQDRLGEEIEEQLDKIKDLLKQDCPAGATLEFRDL